MAMDPARRPRAGAASSRPAEVGPPEPHASTRSLDRIDRIDRKIVHEPRRDATLSLAHLAEKVGLSQTPCRRRVQGLEQTGVLTGRVALADPLRLDLGLTVFASVTAPDHGGAFHRRLTEEVDLRAVLSQFAMERVSHTMALPLCLDPP